MSKKMTPCEKLGYKVGDKFTVIKDSLLEKGTIVVLSEDNGSEVPWFTCGSVRRALIIGSNSDVEPVAKLKPAKQALADAIHQNGGWSVAGDCNFVTSNRSGVVKFFNQNPLRNGADWVSCPYSLSWIDLHQRLPNWHQCILSRDEYFTAYPEQEVEPEMKSESEMTIKVSDWHKNGELPPVGEVCEAFVYEDDSWSEVEIIAHKDGIAIGWSSIDQLTHQSRNEKSFRPLRTEQDKAINEMVSEFINYYGDPKGGERYLGIAEKLYDAGYRKEVK